MFLKFGIWVDNDKYLHSLLSPSHWNENIKNNSVLEQNNDAFEKILDSSIQMIIVVVKTGWPFYDEHKKCIIKCIISLSAHYFLSGVDIGLLGDIILIKVHVVHLCVAFSFRVKRMCLSITSTSGIFLDAWYWWATYVHTSSSPSPSSYVRIICTFCFPGLGDKKEKSEKGFLFVADSIFLRLSRGIFNRYRYCHRQTHLY